MRVPVRVCVCVQVREMMELQRIHQTLMLQYATGDPDLEIPKPDLGQEGWDDQEPEEEEGEESSEAGEGEQQSSEGGEGATEGSGSDDK